MPAHTVRGEEPSCLMPLFVRDALGEAPRGVSPASVSLPSLD